MPQRLAYTKYVPPAGKSSPLCIVAGHGLMGGRRNWHTVATLLTTKLQALAPGATQFPTVYAIDVRNHGDSPHSQVHSLETMADDLDAFVEGVVLQDHPKARVMLMGHSMSGVAVAYAAVRAANASHWLRKRHATYAIAGISLVDSAPAPRPKSFHVLGDHVRKMEAMDLTSISSLKRAHTALKSTLTPPFSSDPMVKYFASNLDERNGKVTWKSNVAALRQSFDDGTLLWAESLQLQTTDPSALVPVQVPCHASFALDSPYWTDAAKAGVARHFADATIETVPVGGHFHQVFHPNAFAAQLSLFLRDKGLL
jgi:pimeloyl-ACP methyl ester carboxylesterase